MSANRHYHRIHALTAKLLHYVKNVDFSYSMNMNSATNDSIRFEDEKGKIRVFINDRDLIDMLAEYEKAFAQRETPSPEAGGYGLVKKDEFLIKSYETEADDDLLLFACASCGDSSCWPMVVKVNRTDDEVIWSDFQQPHRDKTSHNFWDYSNFGPFKFDADDYDKQVLNTSGDHLHATV